MEFSYLEFNASFNLFKIRIEQQRPLLLTELIDCYDFSRNYRMPEIPAIVTWLAGITGFAVIIHILQVTTQTVYMQDIAV